jgi:hypothetical protein
VLALLLARLSRQISQQGQRLAGGKLQRSLAQARFGRPEQGQL